MARKPSQRLEGSNRSPNIAEALSARVKDPLWFLARQWQTGAFEAENGGSLAAVDMESRHFPVARLQRGGKKVDAPPAIPLDALVEAETDGDAPAWRAEALEYRFGLETTGHSLDASDYPGFGLDWHHFDLASDGGGKGGVNDSPQSFVPTQLDFPGAPDPRWWRLEEKDAYFDAPREAEPNALSTLLPEMFYLDIDNWYLIPAPMPAGSIREVTMLKVTDSFGVATEIQPVGDDDWNVFALDAAEGSKKGLGANALFAPNIALDILDNEVLEDVRFTRDEQANLVWAWEQRYTKDGETVVNGDRSDGPIGASLGDGYRLMSEISPNWIPYVARQIERSPTDGEIHLRRARTDPNADRDNPQYRSKIVDEAWKLNEEEIPRTGLRVRRIKRFAYGADGAGDGDGHFWVGRHKDAGRASDNPGLRFDYIAGDDETPPED